MHVFEVKPSNLTPQLGPNVCTRYSDHAVKERQIDDGFATNTTLITNYASPMKCQSIYH